MRWLVRLLLGPEAGEEALDERAELLERRRGKAGERAARAWRRREGARWVAYLLARRAGEALEVLRDGGSPSALGGEARHAARALSRSPGLAATVVLSVGLAIGALTVLFAAVHATLLEPLPYPHADRLFRFYTDAPPNRWRFSVADYRALDAQQASFDAVAGYTNRTLTLVLDGEAERVRGKVVTGRFFTLLGIEPLLGRVFTPGDDAPGRPPVAVASYGFWKRRLGGRPEALGRTLRLDGVDHVLVGVLPLRKGPFEHGRDVFAIAQWGPPPRRGPFFVTAFGRLREGIGVGAAALELRAINRRIFPIWRDSYQDEGASWGMMDLGEYVVGDAGDALLLVLGAMGLLLLIACANATNLMVARVSQRRRELAVRRALGASRARLAAHLLAESALLALGGAVLGLALADSGVRLLASAGSAYVPRAAEIGLDGPVLLFLCGITLLSCLLIGAVPALHGTGVRLSTAFRDAGRSVAGSPAGRRAQRALVGLQFAVATPLLIAAALLLGSLARLQQVEPGYRPEGVLTAGVLLPRSQYPDAAAVRVFWDRARERLAALPGVTSLAFSDSRPPDEAAQINNFDLEDDPTPPGGIQPSVPFVAASPGYFRTLGIRLLRGRLLEARDAAPDAPPVVVVDQAWAQRFFPGAEALGRRLRAGGQTSGPWITVVGVVSTVKYRGLRRPDPGTVYYHLDARAEDHPIDRLTLRFRYLVVTADADPERLLEPIRRVVRELDPGVPVHGAATLESLLAEDLEVPRALSALVAAGAGLALLLSVVGIYGVMAYFVQQHTREIGVRIALGGGPSRVWRHVVGRGLGLVTAGVCAGLVAAVGLSRFLASLLFEIGATDPATFAAVFALMLGVALVACAAPALRAARLDPARTLREE